MTRYVEGRRREWKARHQLERLGYTVGRFAGSKGPYGTDLVAVKLNEILFISVKSGRKPSNITLQHQRDLENLAELVGDFGRVELWYYRQRGRQPLQVQIAANPVLVT